MTLRLNLGGFYMAQHVAFRNPHTGEVKNVKVGFSWTLFFFAGAFGIPLFMRKLHLYGAMVAGVSVFSLMIALADPVLAELSGLLRALQVGIGFTFGFYGNQLTARHYLANNWEWDEPESDAALFAKEKWALV